MKKVVPPYTLSHPKNDADVTGCTDLPTSTFFPYFVRESVTNTGVRFFPKKYVFCNIFYLFYFLGGSEPMDNAIPESFQFLLNKCAQIIILTSVDTKL